MCSGVGCLGRCRSPGGRRREHKAGYGPNTNPHDWATQRLIVPQPPEISLSLAWLLFTSHSPLAPVALDVRTILIFVCLVNACNTEDWRIPPTSSRLVQGSCVAMR
ncbi:hypothetical protein BD309DRAFT_428697 [Dichomitus squalens]|nr:hypothetical protein BD309DRAFT_428697 [Dichomitus squalens]